MTEWPNGRGPARGTRVLLVRPYAGDRVGQLATVVDTGAEHFDASPTSLVEVLYDACLPPRSCWVELDYLAPAPEGL